LKKPCKVIVYTDSEYVKNGITRWATGWVRKNWRGAAGDPVKNMDLWQRLLAAEKPHDVEWVWVRGHDGDEMNERADRLATEARENLRELCAVLSCSRLSRQHWPRAREGRRARTDRSAIDWTTHRSCCAW